MIVRKLAISITKVSVALYSLNHNINRVNFNGLDCFKDSQDPMVFSHGLHTG